VCFTLCLVGKLKSQTLTGSAATSTHATATAMHFPANAGLILLTDELSRDRYSRRLKICARQKYWAQHFRRKFEALPDKLESYFFLKKEQENLIQNIQYKIYFFLFFFCLFSIPNKSIFLALFFTDHLWGGQTIFSFFNCTFLKGLLSLILHSFFL
jgi:hypothetical protein